MNTHFCCGECFGDDILRTIIKDDSNHEIRRCDFCGTEDAPCIPTSEIQGNFNFIHATYIEDPNGKPIVELLRKDWNLFQNENLHSASLDLLLKEIFADESIIQAKYSAKESKEGYKLSDWNKFKNEIIRENRWFTENDPNYDLFSQMLGHLSTYRESLPQEWYRARKVFDPNEIISTRDIGAPPREKAGHGRANPAGISYLYLGSTPKTALTEVRPQKGETVAVGTFRLLSDELTFLDLRTPRETVSPFSPLEEHDIISLREHIEILEHFGKELSTPISPGESQYEYIPTQYICELIKKCDFSGILYNSSLVDDGVNLVLFSEKYARISPSSIQYYSIKKVEIEEAIAD